MKYHKNFPAKLREYAEAHNTFGATIGEISALFKVTRKTVYEWLEKYPRFKEAVTEVQDRADDMVESALFKAATGYEFTEQKLVRDGIGEDSRIIQAYVIKRHKSADAQAMKLWLTNRRPDVWKEKVDVKSSGNVTVVLAEEDTDLL